MASALGDSLLSVNVPDSIYDTLRILVGTAFMPTLFFWMGLSSAYPTLPIYAMSLRIEGLYLGVTLAGQSLGGLSFNVVNGRIVETLGLCWSQVVSCVVAAVAAATLSISEGFCTLLFGLLLQGFAISLQTVGRMAFFKLTVPNEHRGRAISLMGGCFRVGCGLGPAFGGWLAHCHGLRTPFLFEVPCFLVAALITAISFPAKVAMSASALHAESARSELAVAVCPSLRDVIAATWKTLITVGVPMSSLEMLRGARIVLIPLCGHGLGLDTGQIGIAVASSYIVDTALFPMAGFLSDTYGRKHAGIPAFVFLIGGLLALSKASTPVLLVIAGMFTGAGNGLSSGMLITTGADFAPPPPMASAFFGIYTMFGDVGSSGAPLLVGAISSSFGFRAAGLSICMLGSLGLLWYACVVPESLQSQRKQASPEPRRNF